MTILRELRNQGRMQTAVLLAAMSAVCFALSVARALLTGQKTFLFLNWNLFLAFVPWLLTTLYMIKPRWHRNGWVLAAVVCAWLLFFPNAPYILTDLFHLRLKTGVPVWFDLVLIVAFAWTGLLFGLASLADIEYSLERRFPRRAVTVFSVCILFVAGFGVYLGRYLRWNSWDIIQQPSALLSDIGDRLADPTAHPRTWGMTLMMGLLLNMFYWTFRTFRPKR